MMLRAIAIRPPPPIPWQRAEGDELRQVLAEPAQDGADEKDGDGRLENGAAPVKVGDLAPKRRGGGRGQQVGRDHPGELVEAAQLADDARQRRADDALVERGQQDARHQPEEDDDDLLVREVPRLVRIDRTLILVLWRPCGDGMGHRGCSKTECDRASDRQLTGWLVANWRTILRS